jgi:hypothetical protein
MTQITGLQSSPIQVFTAADPNTGSPILFTLTYRPRVQAWFADIVFGSFTLHGFRLTKYPNVLQAYRNIIPFGLALAITDDLDPFLINDLVSGRVTLYLLLASEVAEIQALIEAGTITG